LCGVIGLIYERERTDLGVVAGMLLRTLEYRGYDSTGAAIQGAGEEVILRKGVGAPSVMARELGIVELGGQILCGQVRWATFGAVDELNSQPHVVRCHTHLYGAHNGNVTNCDGLKESLTADGHDVRSDNDGEMLIHVVEHAFAARLAELSEERRQDLEARSLALRQAVKGSSLYFGVGESDEGGRFGIASSDMSSVLKLTRQIVPLLENEFVQFDATGFTVYDLTDAGVDDAGTPIDRKAARSRLAAKDTELRPEFSWFMEQEITDQVDTSQDIVRIFGGGSPAARAVAPMTNAWSPAERAAVEQAAQALLIEDRQADLQQLVRRLRELPPFSGLPALLPSPAVDPLHSSEKAVLDELMGLSRNDEERAALRALDAVWESAEVAEINDAIHAFCGACLDSLERGGRLYVVCCGTSFHAAKVAVLFFAEIAGVELTAVLPGEFRGQHGVTLRDGDLLVAVSQSGETKDLIDVVNDVIASGHDVRRVALVNNVNSTLAQEKCEIVLPLRCGPEIAVPATKSFVNQLTVFYGLALELAAKRSCDEASLVERLSDFAAIPALIERTLRETDEALDEAAELLYLAPSMHLLATRLIGVAKEGALKVREVVLNHAEGFEGSEFKHGPNTILGFNTIFGPRQIDGLLDTIGGRIDQIIANGGAPADLSAAIRGVLADRGALVEGMRVDYPLVYITGPEPKDVALTVSQLNTHKIRGSCTVIIAEENADLRRAAEKAPADNPDYRSIYVSLPATGSTLLTVFSSIVAIQRLALKMSVAKLAWLEQRGIHDHGVHPDVPKNVSKSITVD